MYINEKHMLIPNNYKSNLNFLLYFFANVFNTSKVTAI